MSKKDYLEFQRLATEFSEKHEKQRLALERCLESKVNDDINFICQKPKSDYLLAVADTFCKKEYDDGVKCQKAAGEAWASKCFQENVAFGQCTDLTLKKLYVFNLQRSKKNPATPAPPPQDSY